MMRTSFDKAADEFDESSIEMILCHILVVNAHLQVMIQIHLIHKISVLRPGTEQ